MRILEILIVILLLLFSIQFFLPAKIAKIEKKKMMGWIGVVYLFVILIHIVLEGYRWQMMPLYPLAIIFITHSLYQLRELRLVKTGVKPASDKGPPSKKKIAGIIIIATVLVTGTFVLDFIFPVFSLPEPTGTQQIGTVTFDLTDSSRSEIFTETNDDYRRILVQVWYPADSISGLNRAPYIYAPSQFGTGIAQSFGFPALVVSHYPLIQTHSYENAPVSQDESDYPVLLFSHGYGGLVMQDTVLMEELASHGYIVFSICHPYESAVASFPDGSVIYEGVPESIANISNSLQVWADDTLFLIDQLEISDNDDIPSLLWGHLDLDLIGAFGHSFGGTTAEEVCVVDPRIDVGISFDSPHYGNSLIMNMTKPFMLLFGPDYGNPEMNDTVFQRSQSTCYGLFVNGTRHYNFADVNIWSPVLKSFGLLGSIDGYRMLDILNKYVLAFFDKHIKGETESLLDGPSASYPEVLFYSKGL